MQKDSSVLTLVHCVNLNNLFLPPGLSKLFIIIIIKMSLVDLVSVQCCMLLLKMLDFNCNINEGRVCPRRGKGGKGP